MRDLIGRWYGATAAVPARQPRAAYNSSLNARSHWSLVGLLYILCTVLLALGQGSENCPSLIGQWYWPSTLCMFSWRGNFVELNWYTNDCLFFQLFKFLCPGRSWWNPTALCLPLILQSVLIAKMTDYTPCFKSIVMPPLLLYRLFSI